MAVGLGALASLAALLQLLVGPDVGLADNGDGFRLMCEFGLLKSEDVLFNPLIVGYRPVPYGCAAPLEYFSSQQWVVAPALELYQLRYGAQSGFDLRALGVVHSLLFGAALALMFLALPGSRPRRVLTVLLAGLLLTDISFVTYFTSPFSEPATFLGLLLVVVAAAWYVRSPRPAAALVLLSAAGVFLSLAKSQAFAFALLLVPVLLLRRVPLGGLTGAWTGRLAPALAAVAVVGASGANLLQQPVFFTQVNVHNLTFQTLLPDSADPAGTLRKLGAPPGLTRYQGTGFFDPAAAGKQSDPEYQAFQSSVSRGDILGYLATSPRHWVPMLREGARAVAVVRVDYLSNYRELRPLGELLAPRPDPATRLLSGLGATAWPLLPLGWLAVAVAGAVVALRRGTVERRSTAVVCYLLAAGALSQVVVALLGDGYYELVKHTVLAGYATALLVAIGLPTAVSAVGRRLRGRRPDPVAGDGRESAREVGSDLMLPAAAPRRQQGPAAS